MKKITCMMLGKSGSGKGTQAELLIKYLQKKDPGTKIVNVEMGARFRKFKESGTYAAELVKEVVNSGGFLPVFLPIYNWTQALIDDYTGKEHVIFDGVCRQPEEGTILDGAMQFFKLENPVVLLLDIHHDVARERLLKRGRHDDKHEAIAKRFSEFEKGAVPSLKHFEKSPTVKFVTINGDQTVENVHKDILAALGI